MEGGSVRIWDWLAGASGVALIVGSALPWYHRNAEDVNAWNAFEWIDLLLLFTGFVAISLPLVAALKATDKQTQKLVIGVALLGLLCLVLTIYRIAEPSNFDKYPFLHTTIKIGAYVTLVGSAVMLASALLSIRSRLARRARV
jgi:hypothetical protein